MDVEKVYSDIVSGKVSISEIDNENMGQSASKIRKVENSIYHKCRQMKFDSSADADDSSNYFMIQLCLRLKELVLTTKTRVLRKMCILREMFINAKRRWIQRVMLLSVRG